MQPVALAALAVICFFAGAAKGLTGFGAALIMAPLFSLLIAPAHAAVLIVLLHVMTGWQGARTWWADVQWPRILIIAAIALVFHQLTLPVLSSMNDAWVRKTIGAVVLLLGLSSLCGVPLRNSGGVIATFTAAMTSGIFTALGGLGGPPVVAYFAGQSRTDAHLRANLLAYFMVLFGGAALGLAARGDISGARIGESMLLAPFFFIGMIAGSHLFIKLSSRSYQRVVQLSMIGIGVFALAR